MQYNNDFIINLLINDSSVSSFLWQHTSDSELKSCSGAGPGVLEAKKQLNF